MADNKDDKFDELLLMGMAYQTVRAGQAQDLKDDGYTVEEIADELDMDEDLVEEIVGGDEDSNYSDYDY